jgi:hypothetical protein
MVGSFAFAEESRSVLGKEEARCDQRARELFKQKFGSGVINVPEGRLLSCYRSHYSRSLNQCFSLYTTWQIPNEENDESWTVIVLYGVDDEEEYGNFYQQAGDTFPTYCKVLEQECSSEREWDSLVLRYMDE